MLSLFFIYTTFLSFYKKVAGSEVATCFGRFSVEHNICLYITFKKNNKNNKILHYYDSLSIQVATSLPATSLFYNKLIIIITNYLPFYLYMDTFKNKCEKKRRGKNEKNKVRKPLVSDFVLNSFRTHNAKEGSEALGFCFFDSSPLFCVIRKTEIIKIMEIYKNIEKHRKTSKNR